MSIKNKFYLILVGFGMAIVISSISSYFLLTSLSNEYNKMIENIKVNGFYYKKIVLAKDLTADILPPPMYIVESYLICNQIYNEKNPDKLKKLIEKSYQLKNEYLKKEYNWNKDLPTGAMKDYLLINSKESAYNFFNIRDNKFLPAIEEADYLKANKILVNELNKHFEEHKKFIEIVVENSNKFAFENEKVSNDYQESRIAKINEMLTTNSILLLSINLILLIFFTIITLIVVLKFTRNLKFVTNNLIEISKGNLLKDL